VTRRVIRALTAFHPGLDVSIAAGTVVVTVKPNFPQDAAGLAALDESGGNVPRDRPTRRRLVSVMEIASMAVRTKLISPARRIFSAKSALPAKPLTPAQQRRQRLRAMT